MLSTQLKSAIHFLVKFYSTTENDNISIISQQMHINQPVTEHRLKQYIEIRDQLIDRHNLRTFMSSIARWTW